jgi:hypothetical protein
VLVFQLFWGAKGEKRKDGRCEGGGLNIIKNIPPSLSARVLANATQTRRVGRLEIKTSFYIEPYKALVKFQEPLRGGGLSGAKEIQQRHLALFPPPRHTPHTL